MIGRISRTALLGAMMMTGELASGAVLYVDDDAPPGGNGLSWKSAYAFLQDALTTASLPGSGIDEIRIAQGTYRPDQSGADFDGTGDRAATFLVADELTLRGGYLGLSAGRGANPDDRDVNLFPTILTGDLSGDDEPDSFDGTEENAYQVIAFIEVFGSTVLDGVTVRGGRADGLGLGPTPASQDQGAGINIYYSTVELIDCTIEQNWSLNHGAVNNHGTLVMSDCVLAGNFSGSLGGGLYVHHGSPAAATNCEFSGNSTLGEGGGAYDKGGVDTIFTGCTFTGNSANLGGGLYASDDSRPHVENCTFENNTAATGGGAFVSFSDPTFLDCSFTLNEAVLGEGGGGMWNAGGNPIVTGCWFAWNTGTNGGALYNGNFAEALVTDCTFLGNLAVLDDGGALSNNESTTIIADCLFLYNTASGFLFERGGGISNYISAPTILNCMFLENVSEYGGGGLYNEGGLILGGFPLIIGCIFEGNTADIGGGIHNFNCSARIVDCLIANNFAVPGSTGWGGGIGSDFGCNTEIINCTIVGNSADLGGGMSSFSINGVSIVSNSIFWGNTPDSIFDDDDSPAVIRYSIIEGGWPGPGEAILDVDPLLVDPAHGDFHLSAASPAIDAGHNWLLIEDAADIDGDKVTDELLPLDLEGQPRFMVGRDGSAEGCGATSGGAIVDLGAFEFPGVPSPDVLFADLNGDGSIGFADLLATLADWGPCAGTCCLADLDLSGEVDFSDLLVLLDHWEN